MILKRGFHEFLYTANNFLLNNPRIFFFNHEKKSKVIESYQSSYPDPFIVNKGEILQIDNKKCNWDGWVWLTKKNGDVRWVPIDHIKIKDKEAKFIKNYNSIELSVFNAQLLTMKKEFFGWIWPTDENSRLVGYH